HRQPHGRGGARATRRPHLGNGGADQRRRRRTRELRRARVLHPRARAMSDEHGWAESTEGDLDPDLAEEAPYSAWDPPEREWWPLALRVGAVVLILVIALGSLAVVLR